MDGLGFEKRPGEGGGGKRKGNAGEGFLMKQVWVGYMGYTVYVHTICARRRENKK